MIAPPVRSALKQVVALLVAGNFNELQKLDRVGRMKADEWRDRVKQYGKTLVDPGPENFDGADVVPIRGSDTTAWSVHYRLWTQEEGRSDLSLELTVRYAGGDDVGIELDDLLVD